MIGRFVSTATLGVAVVVADEIQDVTCAAPKVVDGDDESCLLQVKTATEYEAGVQSGAEIEAEEEMARAYTDYADSKLMQEGEEDSDWSDDSSLKLMQEGEEKVGNFGINAQDRSAGRPFVGPTDNTHLLQEGEERGPHLFHSGQYMVAPQDPKNFQPFNSPNNWYRQGKGTNFANWKDQGSNIETRSQRYRQRNAQTFKYDTGYLLQEGEEEEMARAAGETNAVVAAARLNQEGEQENEERARIILPDQGWNANARLMQEGEQENDDTGYEGNAKLMQEGEEVEDWTGTGYSGGAKLNQEGEHAGAESEEERISYTSKSFGNFGPRSQWLNQENEQVDQA